MSKLTQSEVIAFLLRTREVDPDHREWIEAARDGNDWLAKRKAITYLNRQPKPGEEKPIIYRGD